MDLKLFDTARGEVVAVEFRDAGKFSMYVCGPTVYDYPHIGHGRAMLVYDVLRRYLESRGVEVHHVSNITDIDDKIIARANEAGRTTEDLVAQYEAEWYAACDALNVLRPHQDPHATDYVEQMIALIQELIEKGVAYETSDTVYLACEKVPGYGLLARQSIESLKSGARIEANDEKKSPIDFALWKKAKPGEPSWESPFGAGRPGWHTECVVMSLDLLGDGFDLHAGGQDLMFPHHENERAQAVALGKTFAKHWIHHGFIEVGGEKMSKSLDNFTTLTDLLAKVDHRAYRMLVLRAHYRSPVEVTPETIADAESALRRLDEFARKFSDERGRSADAGALDEFNAHMDNDLDTPAAVAEIFSAVREANADGDKLKARAVFAMCDALGLTFELGDSEVDDTTADLLRSRDEARANKDWAGADAIRDELRSMGWVVEDTPNGTAVHR